MLNGRQDALAAAARRYLLGELRLTLGLARTIMRGLRADGLGYGPEFERLATRTELALAELDAMAPEAPPLRM